MRQKSGPEKAPAEQFVKDIRRATRRQFSAEEKIRIVLEGVRGEESIADMCRREGIPEPEQRRGVRSQRRSAHARQIQDRCDIRPTPPRKRQPGPPRFRYPFV